MRIVFLLLLLSFELFAVSKEKAQDLLPLPLKDFKVHHTTLVEVEKALGKAHLSEGRDRYWERDGFKYAVKLSFNKKSVLTSIHYTFPKERPSLDKLGEIDTQKLLPYPASGKSAGRYLLLKEKESEFLIDPISKTVHTVKIL